MSSRLKGTILSNLAHNKNGQAPVPDLSIEKAGQYGYQPHFEGYVSNTGYTPTNIIPILVEAPRGMRYLPDSEKWIATLKSLMEVQSKNITGLRRGVNVEYSERQVGGAGHMQRDPNNVTEEISTPTHVWDERYNSPIQSFWEQYIRNLIGDPITKEPGIMTLSEDVPTDRLADMFSFTMLYIEPDPLRRHVVAAWLVNNMAPTSSGVLESQMDPTAGQPVPELSLEFNGMPVRNVGVNRLAQQRLDAISWTNAGPMQRPAFVDKIAAEVSASENGYSEAVSRAAQEGIQNS